MKNSQVSMGTLNKTFPTVSPENLPKILEENVGNFCSTCGKTIFSRLLETESRVYLEQICCKKNLVLLENDIEFFQKCKENMTIVPLVPDAKNYHEAIFRKPNHAISSLFLYVTKRCNINCPICFQKYQSSDDECKEASLGEIKKTIEKYNSQKILLFGGEPTVREDILEIIKIVKESGNIPGIITNGLKLQDKNYVEKLKKAGLKSVYLQFDGFNKDANKKLRGHDYLEERLLVLKNLQEIGGLSVCLCPVIGKDINEAEMSNILQFALKNNKLVDQISFLGLVLSDNKKTTTGSDLIKIMEREGYFDRDYFLESLRMYRNIYKVTREIFNETLLENWIMKKMPGNFNAILFKKKVGPVQLLFQRHEINKINNILDETLKEKNKIKMLLILLKNSKKLIRSPLLELLKEHFLVFNKALPSGNLLKINFPIITKEFLNFPRRNLFISPFLATLVTGVGKMAVFWEGEPPC